MTFLRSASSGTSGRPLDDGSSAAPSLRIYSICFIAFAVSLCWPILVSGNYYVFPDTASYIRGGDKIWDVFFHLLDRVLDAGQIAASSSDGAAVTETLEVNDRGRNVSGRSFTYSVLISLAFHLAGPIGVALFQAVLATAMISLFLSYETLESPWIVVAGALGTVGLTGLPWYSSYMMPDIFGAFILLFGMILVGRIDDMGPRAILPAVLLVGFAVSTHYGNIILSLVVIPTALALRLMRRRLGMGAILAGIAALSFAPLLNMTASSVVFDEASVTPKRLPIALARSLADGPALWYLQDVCPEADLALCDAYGDNISSDTYWFLWSDEGVLSLSREQFERIKAEEFKVLVGAFKSYPVEQAQAFLGNGAAQLFKIGIDGLQPAVAFDANHRPEIAEAPGSRAFRVFFDDVVIQYTTLASTILLLVSIVAFGLPARWFDMLAVFWIGFFANAYIFGGLSAPIERYQGRIAWLIPLVLIVYLAETASRRRRRVN